MYQANPVARKNCGVKGGLQVNKKIFFLKNSNVKVKVKRILN